MSPGFWHGVALCRMVFLFFLAFLWAQILDCTTFYPDFNTEVQWAKTSEVDCPWVFKGSAGAMRNSLLEGQAILQSQFQGFNLMACSFRLERKRRQAAWWVCPHRNGLSPELWGSQEESVWEGSILLYFLGRSVLTCPFGRALQSLEGYFKSSPQAPSMTGANPIEGWALATLATRADQQLGHTHMHIQSTSSAPSPSGRGEGGTM